MRRLGWVVAVVAAAVLGGCGSDDKDPVKPPPGPKYPPLTSPQNVLEALVISYVSRDSTAYDSLYDHSYEGTSTDLYDPPGSQVSTFRYGDEVAHIAALAKSTTISSIFVDFGAPSSWIRLPSDDPSHPEWAMIQVASTHIEIYDGPVLYTVQAIGPMTFSFDPTVTAPGDTTWTIIRWNEVIGGGP